MITFKQFLGNSFLLESRTDVIAQQMGPRLQIAFQHDSGRKPEGEITPLQIVQHLAIANPKYVQWTARQYVDGAFKWEDIPQLKADFIKFQQLSKADALEQRDIGGYKTLSDLRQVISGQHVAGVEYKGKLEKLYQGIATTIKEGHGRWIYNNPEDPIKIFVPTDETGSIAIRRAYPDIGWCTTYEDDMDEIKFDFINDTVALEIDAWEAHAESSGRNFNAKSVYDRIHSDIEDAVNSGEYDSELDERKTNQHNYYIKKFGGEYYVILTPDQPYQFHFESDQFKDQNDNSIDISKMFETYPTIKRVLGPIITKLGHPHFQGRDMNKAQIIKALELAWTNIDRIPVHKLTKADWVDILSKVLDHYYSAHKTSIIAKAFRNATKIIQKSNLSFDDIANIYDHVILNFNGIIRAESIPGKILMRMNPKIGKEKLHGYEDEINLGKIVW